jgi:hypothetical protein
MTHETTVGQAEQYRLMLLVEHLQSQNLSEDEIVAAVREAANDATPTRSDN